MLTPETDQKIVKHNREVKKMKKLKSYRLDQQTIDLIVELKTDFHLENNSAVIRKALLVLKLFNDFRKNNVTVVLKQNGQSDRELIL